MDRLNYGYSDLEEAINFFQNEIKQHEVAMTGILRKEYREYLIKKTKYYQAAIEVMKEFFCDWIKEG